MRGEPKTYANTRGLRLLRELTDRGRFIFSTEEAREVAEQLAIPASYLHQLLPRLAESGWLLRLRRGLYAVTSGLLGEAPPPFAIATRLVTPSAISHWSALHHHGLTEQIPQGVTASTPTKVVTPSMRDGGKLPRGRKHVWEVGGIAYEYVTVRPEHFFGIEEVWIDERFRVPITDRERTLLDGFAAPRRFGGMNEVLGILAEHQGEFDPEKLVEYALKYGKASVAKRLGWSLERLGVAGDLLVPLEAVPVSGIRLLDPTRPRQGRRDRRWLIQNNLGATNNP